MKLSTKGRYATRVLLDLAIHADDKPVPLKDIARRQQISLQYLEHLISPLIAAGMMRSTRGARGGVWLAKPPQEVKLSEVIELLEGSTAPVDCVNDPKACSRANSCVTRDIWIELKRATDEVLQSKTMQDLIDMHKKKEKTDMVMYNI